VGFFGLNLFFYNSALHGVKLIVSDAHGGLKAARIATFPSVPWQRCQFHLQQNAQQYVSKRSQKKAVAADIRGIFNAASFDDALLQLQRVVKKYESSMSALSCWLADNIEEGLTIMTVTPPEHWCRLRTSNIAELVNKEVKRRTRITGLFPNIDSCLRLVSAVLVEIDEAWDEGYVYLDMSVKK
jgi:transposase-like protein